MLKKFSILGEEFLSADTDLVYTNNITAIGDTEIGYITKTEFEKCIGGDIIYVGE